MITETKKCPKCGSEQLIKNGKTGGGKQKFRCHSCGATGTLDATWRYTEEEKERILSALKTLAAFVETMEVSQSCQSCLH